MSSEFLFNRRDRGDRGERMSRWGVGKSKSKGPKAQRGVLEIGKRVF